MSDFIKLTPNQAIHVYKLPPKVVRVSLNAFYGTNNIPNDDFDDGPWPLIAFLHNNKNQLFFQVCTLHQEFMEFDDFNPLNDPLCGYISLRKQSLKSLSKVLIQESKKLALNIREQPVQFEPIHSTELNKYRLNRKNHPETSQFYWRIRQVNDNSSIRLVTISISTAIGPYIKSNDRMRVFMQFQEFSTLSLNDENFIPLKRVPSKITLNRSELIEFSSIIDKIISDYVNS